MVLPCGGIISYVVAAEAEKFYFFRFGGLVYCPYQVFYGGPHFLVGFIMQVGDEGEPDVPLCHDGQSFYGAFRFSLCIIGHAHFG